jgi:hypothetical protein
MTPGQRPRAVKPFSDYKLKSLLVHALENAWDPATQRVYFSHLKSYFRFVNMHHLKLEPSPLNLALYVVYMSEHIKPSSVESYLTGICHYLSIEYPRVNQWREDPLVRQALRGSKKIRGTPTKRKRPLLMKEIKVISNRYFSCTSHDDLLFHVTLLTGFFALLRLGELICPDDRTLDISRKLVKRATLKLSTQSFQFDLPYHKADRFFSGNTVLVRANNCNTNPVRAMTRYILSRDKLFPDHEEMWLRADGERPRRRWFLRQLHVFFDDNVAGHSLRSGGATALAQMGVSLDIIQAMGRWSGDAFRSYIRLHPMILHNAIQEHQRSLRQR